MRPSRVPRQGHRLADLDRTGDKPYPCRYVITSKGVDQAPQFTMEIREWKAGAGAAAADFAFKAPAGAKRMDVKDLAGAEGNQRPAGELQIGRARNDHLQD